MQLQFFKVPVHVANAADELNRFLSTHRVSSIDRQFVADGPNSAWSICVTYEAGDPPRPTTKAKERIDYREILPEDQFRIFSKLRDLRKELSERDEVPAYTVFNNEHLAEADAMLVLMLDAGYQPDYEPQRVIKSIKDVLGKLVRA